MSIDFNQLAQDIKRWGRELGFSQLGITDFELAQAGEQLNEWLQKKWHGEMHYMEKHAQLRQHPEQLFPNLQKIIMVRLDYLPVNTASIATLNNPKKAYIARYALGRDYHKLIRKRLTQLAEKITEVVGEFGYRAFADSAPIMEKPLAQKAGLGWIGKNTLLLNNKAGSWFFLGALFTDLPLPSDQERDSHCGSCQACIDLCPTQAIVGPYQLDARRCISYLTIEHHSSIPLELRPLMGNRIFGCDDCQLVCPWNKFAKFTQEKDFHPRHHLDTPDLIRLFNWSEAEFLSYTEGSAIRRTGYQGWLRNLAVALGNAPRCDEVIAALTARLATSSELVQEHILWALEQHKILRSERSSSSATRSREI
jgi:epoxyqueuosine reductase